MDVGLGWLGVGVGAAGFVVAFSLCSGSVEGDERRTAGVPWPAVGFVLVATLILWGISRQTLPPFSPGQTLGWGFLIGALVGIAAIVAASALCRTGEAALGRTSALAAHGMAFLGLLGASLTYSIFHSYPQNAMLGFAMGAVMTAILAPAGSPVGGRLAGMWALFAVTLAAGVVLAVEHFDQDTFRIWWPLPILIAVTTCSASYVGTEIGFAGSRSEQPGRAFGLAALVSAVLVIGLSAIYSWRIVGAWEVVGVVAAGTVTAAVTAWLAASSARTEDPLCSLEAACAAMLLVTALAVVAFRLWAGLGIALGLAGAWSVVLPGMGLALTRPTADSLNGVQRTLRAAMTFGLAILLFRLFVQYYGPGLGTRDLRVHYTFIGAILGFIASVLFGVWAARARTCAEMRELALLGLLGFAAAASPVVLFVIWGAKAVMGFLFGIAVYTASTLANGFAIQSGSESYEAEHRELPILIGAMLVAIQFTRPLMEVELTRGTRIWVLALVLAIGVLWFVLSGIASSRKAR